MGSYNGWLRAGAVDHYDGQLRPDGADATGPTVLDATGGAKATAASGGAVALVANLTGGAASASSAGGTPDVTAAAAGGSASRATAGAAVNVMLTLAGGASATATAGGTAELAETVPPELPPFGVRIETSPGRAHPATVRAGGQVETARPAVATTTLNTGRY